MLGYAEYFADIAIEQFYAYCSQDKTVKEDEYECVLTKLFGVDLGVSPQYAQMV